MKLNSKHHIKLLLVICIQLYFDQSSEDYYEKWRNIEKYFIDITDKNHNSAEKCNLFIGFIIDSSSSKYCNLSAVPECMDFLRTESSTCIQWLLLEGRKIYTHNIIFK